MHPLSARHPDPMLAAAADDFETRFRTMLDALRLEVAAFGEPATIRRVLLDSSSAIERGALLAVLGHCTKMVVKVTSPDDAGALAWEARAVAFLDLLAGEPLSVETLRPLQPLLESDDELAVFSANDQNEATQLIDQHREAP